MKVQNEFDFKKEDFKEPFLEKSRFKIMFSSLQSDRIKKEEKELKKVIRLHNVKLKIDFNERTIDLRTTTKTRDPYSIISAKDFVSLFIRGVDINESIKVFEFNNTHLIINLNQLVKDKAVMVNRRDRLIGPKGDTIKALKLLTKCFIQVEKKSVCVIGSFDNVIIVEEFIKKCMSNFHPVHLLKQLIAKDELKNDKNKKEMDWTNFVPEVKKKINKKSKL